MGSLIPGTRCLGTAVRSSILGLGARGDTHQLGKIGGYRIWPSVQFRQKHWTLSYSSHVLVGEWRRGGELGGIGVRK